MTWVRLPSSHRIRPHYVDSTASRPICEVKLPQAGLVVWFVRTCEVLVLNFRLSSQENFRVFDFAIGFDSRLATGCAMNPRPRICSYLLSSMFVVVHPGGLAQMAERPLCMRQARGSMPLSSTHHNNTMATSALRVSSSYVCWSIRGCSSNGRARA